MRRWDDDHRDYEEPGWWRSLTPTGQYAVVIAALLGFTVLMVLVGTVEWMP